MLQGYFHPRHTIADVYQWVSGSINATSCNSNSNSSSSDSKASNGAYGFELYTSPPRNVLHAYVQVKSNGNKRSASISLVELGLVPAAHIFLSWDTQSDLYAQIAGSAMELGAYISPELLREALQQQSDASEPTAISNSNYFPAGKALVEQSGSSGKNCGSGSGGGGLKGQSAVGSSAAAESKDAAASDAPSTGGRKLGGGGGKPKWFKI